MITLDIIQKRLAEAIRHSGLSQTEIAERLGVNPSQILCYVHGKKLPALDTFANLCAIIDVNSNDILALP